MSKGKKVDIVLTVKDKKDGSKWYKIKNDSGFAYIKAQYVTVSTKTEEVSKSYSPSKNYPYVRLTNALEYRAYPDSSYPVEGKLASGIDVSVIGLITDADDNSWYQLNKDQKMVYAPADKLIAASKGIDEAMNVRLGELTPKEMPEPVSGVTTDALNVRKDAGTSADKLGLLDSGDKITINGTKMDGDSLWYEIIYSNKAAYVSADYVSLRLADSPTDSAPEEISVTKEVSVDPSSLVGSVTFVGSGTYKPKDGSTWFNASPTVVGYYLDPRNFINEDRIFMFEDLSYKSEYQTVSVVTKILSPTKLPSKGFTAKMFVNAGAQYNVSPVHLASRARQETGGGSSAIDGTKINGTKVYNPFNIGASSGSNPVRKGLEYAYNKGWTTQTKAVNGGASFIASGYINNKQNSIYLQRFNVANGASKAGTHQYMTNIQAPYSEAYSTKTAYKSYGITNEALTFVIPVFTGMPSSTKLP